MNEDRFIACFWGTAIGDAYGAPYEGGFLERLLWRILGKTRSGRLRYTDDTQMSLDTARSLLAIGGVDQQDLATRYAASYRWSRGYGISAAKTLRKIKNGANWQEVNRLIHKEGSMGNGAAMRAPVVALFAFRGGSLEDIKGTKDSIAKVSEITHAHPLAIEGAYLIAAAVIVALKGASSEAIIAELKSLCESDNYRDKLTLCQSLLLSPEALSPKEVARRLGSGMLATESCVTAIYFALQYLQADFDSLLNVVLKIRGDVDTIASMACAIWGASNGTAGLQDKALSVEGSEQIKALAVKLYSSY